MLFTIIIVKMWQENFTESDNHVINVDVKMAKQTAKPNCLQQHPETHKSFGREPKSSTTVRLTAIVQCWSPSCDLPTLTTRHSTSYSECSFCCSRSHYLEWHATWSLVYRCWRPLLAICWFTQKCTSTYAETKQHICCSCDYLGYISNIIIIITNICSTDTVDATCKHTGLDLPVNHLTRAYQTHLATLQSIKTIPKLYKLV